MCHAPAMLRTGPAVSKRYIDAIQFLDQTLESQSIIDSASPSNACLQVFQSQYNEDQWMGELHAEHEDLDP